MNAKSDYEAAPTQSSLDTFKQDRLITNVIAGTALAAAAVGLVVWVVLPRSSRTTSSLGRMTF